jgi:hypothetical protein
MLRFEAVRGLLSTALPLVVVILPLACSASEPPPARPAPSLRASGAARYQRAAPPASNPTASPPLAAAPDPILLVTDPIALSMLDQHGYALGDWLIGHGTGRLTNAQLVDANAFDWLTRAAADDLSRVTARDPQAGVKVSRFPHRLFDSVWLRSPHARFELTAVVNRLDRAPFEAGSCGEIRLIYRLAYATAAEPPVASRLPMTLGIEIEVPRGADGCVTAARRWVPPKPLSGSELAVWLGSAGAPLDPATLGDATSARHRIVVNLQQVRWPSAVRPDLGGHAEYGLRSFRPTAQRGHYEPEPLENTPDAERLARDSKLKSELLAWLSEGENLKAVDVGTPFLPARFLATRAESVTPRGLARRKNRPFSALFPASALASLDLAGLATVHSPEALLRRLDELTCPGCHEARSIAGFHVLGDDPAEALAGNALLVGTSPHVLADLARRGAVVRALMDGRDADFSQPFPERSSSGGYGAHCGLGADPTFSAWRCNEGLFCQAYDAAAREGVGQCLPATPSAAGDPCEVGTVEPNANAHRDRVSSPVRLDCGGNAVCNRNAVGFPGGMCTEGCGALSSSSTCGSIAVLEPFNACVARGEPFGACLAEHVRPAGLRACSAGNPCRDDYVCARTTAGGACIPPYFLFQLRVDGHPAL